MWTIVGALTIGLSLGLLGSGGSILTVPILVYLLGHEGKPAIAESLAIVGGIALAGSIPYGVARLIDWRNVVFFGVPGMAGTYGGALVAQFISDEVQLVLFALVMLLAAWMMYRRTCQGNVAIAELKPQQDPRKIIIEGMSVGILTGLVGVGGGFLIIPALVLLGGLPMRLAVGTSLVVIAAKSFAGFWAYLMLHDLKASLDWTTIVWFVLIGIVGTFLGNFLGTKLNQKVLQRVFAVFLVVMGGFVLTQEIPKLVEKETPTVPDLSHTEANTTTATGLMPSSDLHPSLP